MSGGEDIDENLGNNVAIALNDEIYSSKVWYGTTHVLKHSIEKMTTGCVVEIPSN